MCRDEETGVAATRRAFTAVTSEKRMDSDSDNEEDGGYSDTEEHHEEFDVKPGSVMLCIWQETV